MQRLWDFLRDTRRKLQRRRVLGDFFGRFRDKPVRTAEVAVIVHLFYFDLWGDIAAYLAKIPGRYDLYVSVPPLFAPDVVRDIAARYPQARFRIAENRGRDIAPFLQCLKEICDLGYTAVCKIHSKRSPHLEDGQGWKPENGETWRSQIFEELLGSKQLVERILDAFTRDSGLGMVGPAGSLLRYLDVVGDNRENVRELMQRLDIAEENFTFFAGSMFWFRPASLKNVVNLQLQVVDFPPEAGQVDGTLAHAVERILTPSVRQGGWKVLSSPMLE